MYAIGSDQEDATNEFDWIVTTYTFDEYERWQGAYGNAKSIGGMVRLRSIGFFKSSCQFEEEKVEAKSAISARNIP